MGFFWWLPFGKVPEISAAQLHGMCQDGLNTPQILDVRTGMEWRAGHVAGAVHTPITELESRLAGLNLDGNRPIVAICRSAHRSIPAVRLLHKHGYRNACQLQGGMQAWWKANLPLVSDSGDALGDGD